MRFRDREDAGRQLAARLGHLRDEAPIVLALPRGGVPVGAEVARALAAPLDVFMARKIGAPGQPELAIGAVAEGGGTHVDRRLAAIFGVSEAELMALAAREAEVLATRMGRYRGRRPLPDVRGRVVILVDDGVATGATVRAAIRALRVAEVGRIVVAVPVAPEPSLARLRAEADEVVAVESPADLLAIGAWYRDFHPLEDGEVVEALARGIGVRPPPLRPRPPPRPPPPPGTASP